MQKSSDNIEQAFTQMIAEHQGIIHKVCGIYCPRPDERRDLFQDILLQLWRAYPSFKGNSKVSTWMYRIALNTAITQFRKQKRRPVLRQMPAHNFEMPDPPNDTIVEERLSSLHRAIAKLNQIEKAIVMLHLDEHSYQQIAQIMGISESNVGVKLHRIKNKLKNLMMA